MIGAARVRPLPSSPTLAAAVVAAGALGAALVEAPAQVLPVLALGALLLAVVTRRQEVVLGAAAAAVVASSINATMGGVQLAVRTWAFYGKFALMALLFIGARWHRRAGVPLTKGARGFAIGLGLLACFSIASTGWSPQPGTSLQEGLAFGVLAMVVLAYLVWRWTDGSTIVSDLRVLTAVAGLALLAGLVVGLGGVEWAFNEDGFGFFGHGRLRGILQNPNTIGITVPLFLSLSIFFSLKSQSGWRLFWLAITGGMGLSLLMSQSRGGFLATAIALLTYVLVRPRMTRSTRLLVGGLGLLMLVAVVLIVGPGLQQRSTYYGTDAGRFAAWRIAGDLVGDRPVAGWGIGSGDVVFAQRAAMIDTTKCGMQCFSGGAVHSGYLQALLELGPAGLITLCVTLAAAILAALRGRTSELKAAVVAGAVGGIASQLVESGFTAAGSILAFNLWLLAAACARSDLLSDPVHGSPSAT